ncbi:MAG: type II secretion system F family protein [Bacteroidota bacterium]
MNLIQIAFLALVFMSVFGLAVWGMFALAPNAARDRLHALVPTSGRRPASTSWVERVLGLTARFGSLSIPEEGWEQSGIRTRFMNAGIRSASAPMLYFGAKTSLAIGLPVLAYLGLALFGSKMGLNGMLLVLLMVAAIGYYLPNMVLSRWVQRRQREVFETFPDALDLMIVCIEAGLGIEVALNRVAEDIAHKSEALSDELRLVGLELRAGSNREHALRNLALRTGVEEVDTWVTMIIQADRFGTSIAAALRIHSEMLRTKRRQRAEEAAAKIALKLLFPLIFCIFPSLMLVLLGPAFIQIHHVLLPTLAGGH